MLTGRYGAFISLRYSLVKSTFFIHSWRLSSSMPAAPRRLLGFLCSSWLMKPTASNDQRLGSSSSFTAACLLSIWSLISLRFLPTQGLLPSMNSQAMTPTAKQSAANEWFLRHITSGAMQPGVPLVSWQFSSFHSRLTPKSVILMYPCASSTRFYGLMSRWIMRLLCRYYSPTIRLPMKNFVQGYVNLRRRPI